MFHEAALEQNMKVLWRRAETLLIPNQKTSPREKVGGCWNFIPQEKDINHHAEKNNIYKAN